jgi:uncharacterized damage-inducible protein DinB
VSEDRRVARSSGEPSKSGAAGVERWIGYLEWVRAALADGVLAMSEADQRTARVPSGWTPLELLNHVLHMEQRWFVWGFLGEEVDDPWGDWNVDEPWTADDSDETRPAARWTVPPGVTADALAQRLHAIGDRTTSILREHPLDERGQPGGRFDDDPPTLEWICFHVLAEYARHAGHLDIVVELGGA